jgi:5-formyltetrahydrofolate cyclo-ligase
MKSLRAAIGEHAAEVAAVDAANALMALPAVGAARRIAIYVALPDELDTAPLLERLRRCGKSILLPRVDAIKKRLTFHEFDEASPLRRGPFGIAEPRSEALEIGLDPGDVVVLPGLAFDPEGGRLGFGGGYYDRSLDTPDGLRPLLIGYAYECQIQPSVPKTGHDRVVDVIVTERCVRCCAPARSDKRESHERA